MAPVKKIDPETKKAVTLKELAKSYAGKYTKEEISKYWKEDCKAVGEEPEPKAKAKAKAKGKAEAKAEAKAKAKAKPEAKAKAEPKAKAKAEAKPKAEPKPPSKGGDVMTKLASHIFDDATMKKYVPPNSDRAGNTVGDLAPDVFNSNYKGRQDDSKGVIGLLEVILADFDRTGTVVTEQEKMSEQDYQDFKTETEKDSVTKQDSVDTKNGLVAGIKDELVQAADDKMDAEKAYDGAIKELESLETMCVEGEETYEERAAKRKKEIEALKEAHAILEDWKK